MKLKTSELTGAALDCAVAKCENQPVLFDGERMRYLPGQFSEEEPFEPSINWSQGGPIIERENVELKPTYAGWIAFLGHTLFANASTPLIAAMRCYVASKLGDEVDIPEELCK